MIQIPAISGLLGSVGGLLKPVTELVDELHVSDEERGRIRLALLQAQNELTEKTLAVESQLIESQTKINYAEATQGNLLQRSWRPVSMLVFLAVMIGDLAGYLPNRAPEAFWTLFMIGFGGVGVGRSLEKTAARLGGSILRGGK